MKSFSLADFDLRADSFDVEFMKKLLSLFSRPLPHLQALSLGHAASSYDHALSENFLSGVPKLRSLELNDWIPVKWTLPGVHLTSLRMNRSYFAEPVDLPRLLDLLEGMPQLQVLVIHVQRPALPSFPRDRRTVKLHRLEVLHLRFATLRDTLQLLENLVFPTSTPVRIGVNQTHNDEQPDDTDSFQKIFQVLSTSRPSSPSELMTPHQATSFTSLKVTYRRWIFKLRGWSFHSITGKAAPLTFPEDMQSDLDLDISANTGEGSHKIPFTILPLRGLQELSLAGEVDENLLERIGALQHLHSLRLAGMPARALFQFMADHPERAEPSSFLPSLKFLSIGPFRFDESQRGASSRNRTNLNAIHKSDLSRFLHQRAVAGRMVERLELTSISQPVSEAAAMEFLTSCLQVETHTTSLLI